MAQQLKFFKNHILSNVAVKFWRISTLLHRSAIIAQSLIRLSSPLRRRCFMRHLCCFCFCFCFFLFILYFFFIPRTGYIEFATKFVTSRRKHWDPNKIYTICMYIDDNYDELSQFSLSVCIITYMYFQKYCNNTKKMYLN